jgi:hypothetical protein
MTTLSFSNVIDEIKSGNEQQEGRLHKIEEHTRNARRHLLEMKSPLLKMFNNMYKIPTSPISVPDNEDTGLADKESKREMMSLIEKISDNIQLLVDGNTKIGVSPSSEDERPGALNVGPVALLAAGLAGIGTGLVTGYIKAVKVIFGQLASISTKAVKLFAVIMKPFNAVFMKLGTIFAPIAELFTFVKASATSAIGKVFAPLIRVIDSIKSIFKPMAAVSSQLGVAFDGIKSETSTKLSTLFTSLKTSISTKAVKLFAVIMKPINAVFTTLGSVFKPLIGVFAPITELFTFVKASATSAVGKVFAPIMKVVNTIKTIFKPIAAVFGMVSGVVSKIFAPLFVIMTVWDTVKGAMAGYEEGGIVGAISGAAKALINSLITVPLDMLKKGVAWILTKFGFDEEADALKSFSFTDEFNKIIDGLMGNITDMFNYAVGIFTGETDFSTILTDVKNLIKGVVAAPYKLASLAVEKLLGLFGFDEEADAVKSYDIGGKVENIFTSMFNMVGKAVNWIIDLFDFSKTGQILSDKFSSLKNAASDMLKSLVAGILPKRAEGDGMMSWITNQVIDKAIPAGIYEWAGIDQHGTKLPPPIEVAKPSIGSGVDSGFRLALAQTEKTAISTAKERKGFGSVGSNIVDASTKSNVVNNNAVVTTALPAAAKTDTDQLGATFKRRKGR